MRNFRSLDVWDQAHALVLEVYQATESFPRSELFGLTSQLRRASTSVASNIAEGARRNSRRDYARFIDMSIGSTSECEYQVILSRDLGYMQEARAVDLLERLDHVKRKLFRLRQSLLHAT